MCFKVFIIKVFGAVSFFGFALHNKLLLTLKKLSINVIRLSVPLSAQSCMGHKSVGKNYLKYLRLKKSVMI